MGTITPPTGKEKPKSYGLAILFGSVFLVMGLLIVNGILRNRTPEETPTTSPAAAPEKAAAAPEAASPAPPAAMPAVPAKEESPLEMSGWKTFRWGMSYAEAERTAQEGGFSIVERTSNKSGDPILVLSNFPVSGLAFQPRLRFAPGLVSVMLFCPAQSATISVYEVLKRDLTNVFGVPPTSKRGIEAPGSGELVGFKGMHLRDDFWSFPKTTVNLKFLGSVEKPENVLWVSYEDPKSIPDEPLK